MLEDLLFDGNIETWDSGGQLFGACLGGLGLP
jgi:hypothetical protein